MKLFNDIAAQMQKYYLERDMDALKEVVRLATAELENPELQEVIITIPVKMDEIEQTINNQGYIRLGLNDADSTGPVEQGKLIRLFPADKQEEDGCMVLNVAHIDDTQIILVPSGGGV
jgi:hypothetical protein